MQHKMSFLIHISIKLPGGGVKRWETLEAACIREVREEAGVAVERMARLVGLYANFRPERSDHVALFEVADWHPVPHGSWEIAEVGFFRPDRLPPETGPATRDRLAELADGRPPARHWLPPASGGATEHPGGATPDRDRR